MEIVERGIVNIEFYKFIPKFANAARVFHSEKRCSNKKKCTAWHFIQSEFLWIFPIHVYSNYKEIKATVTALLKNQKILCGQNITNRHTLICTCGNNCMLWFVFKVEMRSEKKFPFNMFQIIFNKYYRNVSLLRTKKFKSHIKWINLYQIKIFIFNTNFN